MLRFGDQGIYDGATIAFDLQVPRTPAARRRHAAAAPMRIDAGVRQQQVLVADELRKFSLYHGVDPDLVGVTTWSQPWVPMWLEWEVTVDGLDPPTIQAWNLGQVELERHAAVEIVGDTAVLRGRTLLTTGVAATLHDAISDWLTAEDELDAAGGGLVDEATEERYRVLDAAVQHLDLVATSLDGIRHQLLGFPVSDGLRRPSDGNGGTVDPAPTSAPHAVLAGAVSLTRARLLDTFGRTLEVPIDAVRTPARASLPDRPGALEVAPRLLRPARWNLRLVDSATEPGGGRCRGPRRPDRGGPAGQPGRRLHHGRPPRRERRGVRRRRLAARRAPPRARQRRRDVGDRRRARGSGRRQARNYGLTDAQRVLGRFAAGLVAADAAARRGRSIDPDGPAESALTSLLRAIDTTLWTVDTFAALGSEHVAGLVGRPIAVVRAQLALELRPPDGIDLSDPDRAAEWEAAERLAARYAFPVRIGELTRSDDGVLGFFVDDDYSRFRIVDKVIAGTARETGRSRGQLGAVHPGERAPEHDVDRPPVHRRVRRRRHAAPPPRPDRDAHDPDAPGRPGDAHVRPAPRARDRART